MNKRAKFFASMMSVTALSAISTPAWAQDLAADARDSGLGGDIIVTARRSEERLQDVPISITVLSQQEITNRNILSANDLGSYVPSLATNNRNGADKATFSIRGFVTEGHTAPSVAVYFADVVAPRANGATESGNGAGPGDFMDLQNVQVLKGPQGTLFGRNTTGGAILLVPQKPTDRFEGYVEGSAGSYDLRRLQGAINVPLSDTFRVRAAVDWNQRDGYLRNRSGVGPKRMGDTDYITARLSIVGDLAPNLETYTIATYTNSDTVGVVAKGVVCNPDSGFAFFACAQTARQEARGDGFWDVENNNPNPFLELETWRVINTTTWTASDTLTVKNIASYTEFEENSSFNLWGDNFIYPAGTPGGLAGTLFTKAVSLSPGFSGKVAAQSTFTEEFQLQGRSSNGRLNWQAGAYLEVSKPLGYNSAYVEQFVNCTNFATYQCTGPGFGSIGDSQNKDSFNNKGLYVQATYDLNDQFSVTGGFRYTMDRMSSVVERSNISVPVPGTGIIACSNRLAHHGATLLDPLIVTDKTICTDYFKIKSNRPTWLIGLDYKPAPDLLLYAKWARGYRQGFIFANNLGLETVNPERVDTYEVGAKVSFRGAVSGFFNFAGFYNNFQDQQIAVNATPAPDFIGVVGAASPVLNAGKSRIWGAEVDASITPFTGLKLDVGYSYLNTKLVAFNPPPPPIYYSALISASDVGQPLALSPKNRVTLTGTYTLPLDESIGRISFGATFTHTDAHRTTSPLASPLYLLKASDILNLNASWNSIFGKPFDLSFFMTNATNQKNFSPTLQGYNYIGLDGANVHPPRMWGFRLKYRFGE